MIQSWQSSNKRNNEVIEDWQKVPPRNIPWDIFIPSSDPVVITTMIDDYKLPKHARRTLKPPTMPLVGFSWERSYPEGVVDLELRVVTHPLLSPIIDHAENFSFV
ncbi:hypothetical protein Tco_0549495 [Tanacetum coccineum]